MDFVLAENGKRKRVERSLFVHCRQCNVSLICPPQIDFWVFLKSANVADFFGEHDHGRPGIAGAQIAYVEQEQDES
jgi:predicted aldo/keto reductase-like oxidoreductase